MYLIFGGAVGRDDGSKLGSLLVISFTTLAKDLGKPMWGSNPPPPL